jgi:ABC-2 type transport system permease protein
MAAEWTLERAPVASARYVLGVLPSLLRRNARLWLSFRVSTAMDVLAMVARASVFFFVGGALGASSRDAWGTNYAAFLTVGLVFSAMLEGSLSGPYQSLANQYWFSRLESILLSPCPVSLVVLADVGWAQVRALLNALILVLVGWGFGARISVGGPEAALALVALVLGALGTLGFGLMSGAMFMLLNAKGWNDPVAWLVGILQGLVAGAYFPVTLLPGPLHAVALLLPQTYAIDAARRLLLPGASLPPLVGTGGLSPVASDLAALSVLSAVVLAAGTVLFRAGLEKARRDGGLSRWV